MFLLVKYIGHMELSLCHTCFLSVLPWFC